MKKKENIILLSLILLAIAFVILLLTIYPYYRLNISEKNLCPKEDWINCMPGSGFPKPQCQPKYLDWLKDNCPNFKGVAL